MVTKTNDNDDNDENNETMTKTNDNDDNDENNERDNVFSHCFHSPHRLYCPHLWYPE